MLIYLCMVLMFASRGYIGLPTQSCIWSNRTLHVVNSCPTTREETVKAARIKRCEGLARSQNCTKPSQFKYHCLYSYRQKMFVEVCAVESDVPGVCIVYDTRLSKIQHVYNVKCKDISAACPESYLSTEGHLYATCPGLMNLTYFDTKGKNNNPQNHEENKLLLTIAVILPIIIAVVCCLIFFAIYKRSHLKQDLVNREERIPMLEIDNSTLNDDEVLFCFLCSDSGPPDFTDTEWVDMLNDIRKRMYRKPSPVTPEEAQQALNRLKSRNQDKITEDIKDETIYKIASKNTLIPFCYSSYNTAHVYLRPERYNRKPEEKCVVSYGHDSLLILRLQMNILIHVTMEDTGIYDEIYQILNIPHDMLKNNKDEREQFLINLRREGEAVHNRGRSHGCVNHVTWLWRHGLDARPDIVRSCIGLYQHNDIYIIDNKAYRKPSKIHSYPADVRCLLYCLLLSDKYRISFNEKSHRITKNKIKKKYFPDITDDDLVDLPDGITETRDGVITFISDDIRHDVMYAFVTECLVEDSDLEFLQTTASRDVISEYCRSWDYKRSEGERCLYVPRSPQKMCDLFIDKLQLDIITHCTISDWKIHNSITNLCGVPGEIFKWDQEARERYVEYAKRGTQAVHHARGMIVGCARAGKTTLLKRLMDCCEEDIKEVKSTQGLEVHEEIFELSEETQSLKVTRRYMDQRNNEKNATNVDSKTLTFFDFGGQSAYYACHQIYLTRRAFYVVVVDASKHLDQKVDKKVCDQDGTVFSEWTYGDYFVFWIKSIHTYCGSEYKHDPKPVVLIIATHWEEGNRQFKKKKDLVKSLKNQFPKTSNLSQYINDANCYCTQPNLPLDDVKRCFFRIANHKRWAERIPKEWFFFGIEIDLKKHSERILKISDIKTEVPDITDKGHSVSYEAVKGTQDMLRYYHDAGKSLYFPENNLDQEVIIDVQWFIDAFKHIITDKTLFEDIPVSPKDWDEFYQTGNLRDKLLTDIWKHKDEDLFECLKEENESYESIGSPYGVDHRYLQYHKESLLKFMQRLGLLAVGTESHYVPCMNRKEMEEELLNLMDESKVKTSVLIYRFEFLPFFLFFRLVVACMQEDGWNVVMTQGTSCLFKNAAFFSYLEYIIVLSVTDESIQIQVFCPMQGFDLEREKTCRIRERIEELLNDLAGTFQRKIMFVRGFRCRMEERKTIAIDIKGHFLPEKNIPINDCNMICPLHPTTDRHMINTTELTKYWRLKNKTTTPIIDPEIREIYS